MSTVYRREESRWVKITKDKKGRLQIGEITQTRPKEGDYLPLYFERSLNKFFMNEKLAPEAERAIRDAQRLETQDRDDSPCELEIKVLNGGAIIEELYINNIPIVDYCRQQMKP